jgi:hypothetical protein
MLHAVVPADRIKAAAQFVPVLLAVVVPDFEAARRLL